MTDVDLSEDPPTRPSDPDASSPAARRLAKAASDILDEGRARRNQRWLALGLATVVLSIFLFVAYRLSDGLVTLIHAPSELQKALSLHLATTTPPATVAPAASPASAASAVSAEIGKIANPVEQLLGELKTVVTSVVAVISVLVVAITVLAITILRMTFTATVGDGDTGRNKDDALALPGVELAKETTKAIADAVATVVRSATGSK